MVVGHKAVKNNYSEAVKKNKLWLALFLFILSYLYIYFFSNRQFINTWINVFYNVRTRSDFQSRYLLFCLGLNSIGGQDLHPTRPTLSIIIYIYYLNYLVEFTSQCPIFYQLCRFPKRAFIDYPFRGRGADAH